MAVGGGSGCGDGSPAGGVDALAEGVGGCLPPAAAAAAAAADDDDDDDDDPAFAAVVPAVVAAGKQVSTAAAASAAAAANCGDGAVTALRSCMAWAVLPPSPRACSILSATRSCSAA
eukprot:364584-Chlamydomonas_euryale.AAC.13